MVTFIDAVEPLWLAGAGAALGLAGGLRVLRAWLRRRARKREWLASHHPATIDFTSLAGAPLPLALRAVDMGGNPAQNVRKDL